MKRLLALIFVAVFAVGCTSKEGSNNPVLAKVDGTKITKEDFLKEINRLPEWAIGRFQTEEGQKQFLDELIKKELIYLDAKKKGLHRDKEFKDRVEEFKKMTLIKTILEKEVEGKAKLDPKAVRDFYDKNTDKFKMDSVRAKHILVETETEAEDILKRIQKGESFSGLAKKHSKDKGSASKGGDLGFFSRGKMVPEFEKVAFSLKVGEVSNPVKTRFGYHIIKVTDRKEGRKGDFEEVKNAISRQLTMKKQKELFESYIEGLKGRTKIKTYEAELKALKIGEEQTPKD